MNAIVILFPPLIAAVLVGIPLGGSWAPGVTVLSCLITLALASPMAWRIAAGGSVTDALDPAWHDWVAVDGLSALIILLIALVATTAAIYSVGYVAHGNPTPRKLCL